MPRKKTNEEFQEELKQLRENGRDIYSDDEYINSKTKMWFYCSKGHKWKTTPGVIINGSGCPYCAGKSVIIGETSLWDTHPDIAKLLKNPEDGYMYSAGSTKKVEFVCPICGIVNQKKIENICNRGFSCNECSDKVSYPQKFARALLKQLPVTDVHYEYNPNWIKPYRFDFYFKYLGVEYILEMDGGIGHGNYQFKNSKKKDVDGKRRDLIKNFSALKHGIIIIRIDCNYKMEKRFIYIKNKILHSKLNELFNLNNIDWIECDIHGQEKLVPKVAELYNKGLSMHEIKEVVGYHKSTIGIWLKQAKNIGLCDYNTRELKSRGNRSKLVLNTPVNRYTVDDEYIDSFSSIADAERQTGALQPNISHCCRGFHKTAGGYKWFYANDPNQPDKSKIINSTIQN